MRVVVTGAAGFIGSALVDRLLLDGHDVVGIDCFTDDYPRRAKEANLQDAMEYSEFRLIDADLRSDALEPLLEGADAVVNEAAMPGLTRSWRGFEAYRSVNLDALYRLVSAATSVGVPHLVQASTSSVYGEVASGSEDGPTSPVSPYGVTKLAGEHLLRAHAHRSDLGFTVLRYFSVYGPRQRPDMAYRIFCERLLADEPIELFGDGDQSRNNTYIDDCIDATVAALTRPPAGSTFNIGGGEAVVLTDAVRLLGEIIGVRPQIIYRGSRPGDQRHTTADITRASAGLGWTPRVDLAEGLARQVEWVRARAGRSAA